MCSSDLKVEVRVGQVRREGQRALVACHGLGQPAQSTQDEAEVVVRGSVIGPQRNGVLQTGEAGSAVASLMLEEAEKLSGLGEPGLFSERGAIGLLRFSPLPRSVSREAGAQEVGAIHPGTAEPVEAALRRQSQAGRAPTGSCPRSSAGR